MDGWNERNKSEGRAKRETKMIYFLLSRDCGNDVLLGYT